jgi:hypothetical protein
MNFLHKKLTAGCLNNICDIKDRAFLCFTYFRGRASESEKILSIMQAWSCIYLLENQFFVKGKIPKAFAGGFYFLSALYILKGDGHVVFKQCKNKNSTAVECEKRSVSECCCCMDNRVSTVGRECGHASMCSDCSKRLTRCPICRSETTFQELYL